MVGQTLSFSSNEIEIDIGGIYEVVINRYPYTVIDESNYKNNFATIDPALLSTGSSLSYFLVFILCLLNMTFDLAK